MTASTEESGQRADQKLDDIVRDADDYYNNLRRKHVSDTRLDVAVVSLVVWFASFAVLGLTSILIFGYVISSIVLPFLVAIVVGAGAGLATYVIRQRRGFKFAELGALLNKMKQGGVSSEDGLHLMDAMHQARLVARKRKMDSAFEYGVLAFALVALTAKAPRLERWPGLSCISTSGSRRSESTRGKRGDTRIRRKIFSTACDRVWSALTSTFSPVSLTRCIRMVEG